MSPLRLLLAATLCLGTLHSHAAPTGNLQEQQKNLEAIRSRIDALRKELNASESARSKAQQEVRELESAVSKLQQDLSDLAKRRTALEQRLAELHRQSDELSQRIKLQQAQLEKTLYQQYIQGEPEPLQRLLNGNAPSDAQREQYYLTLLAQNRTAMVASFRKDLSEKQRITEDVQAKSAELSTLLSQQQSKQAELIKQRNRHQELVSALSGKVEKQKKQIGSLQQDEQRLSQLIDKLIQQIAKKAREEKAAAELAARNRAKAPQQTVEPSPPKQPTAGIPSNAKLPLQGNVTGRFGAPREGGGTWKGLFIQANRGTPVKAIAAGQVVFADAMRGFGNLIILDHGDGYLSIYGYNDSLHKRLGDTVKNAETIASSGAGGSDGESGLYFEIRHHGRPLDPLKWANTR